MTTAYLIDDRFLLHDDFEHPENARRLVAIKAALQDGGLDQILARIDGRYAEDDALRAVHHSRMLDHTQRMAMFGGGMLNPDTYLVPESWDAATFAAGTVARAAEAVVGGEARNAFALVRPPGHHATPFGAMGFCLINNVAVAAHVARTKLGLQRVAIIDWDTHHGNGTQDIFYDDPNVLFVSSHTYPFYPGTGHWHEMGGGDGKGTTLNLPLPPGVGDATILNLYEQIVARAVRRFDPQLIIVSAGYDCHWADPLAPMRMSVAGYTRLAQLVYDLADEVCGGKLVLALEGGYSLDALAAGVVGALHVLQGHPERATDPLGSKREAPFDTDRFIAQIGRVHPLLG